MKLMTYNVHSGLDSFGELALERISAVINAEDPDILVLNEVRVFCPRCGNIDQPRYYAEHTGMDYRFAKAIDLSVGVYGIALLSKFPIKSFEVFRVPQVPPEERAKRYEDRVIERAEIETDRGVVTVYGSHFGLSDAEEQNAAGLLLQLISTEKSPIIFMGDLNITPDNPIIARISGILENTEPTGMLTSPAVEPCETIDYIFTKGFETVKSYTVQSLASDHLPRITVVNPL